MVPPPISKIRTVFITGLPGDVKERELQNLLRWFPGFEASQINFKAEQPMGFALFSTAQHAMAAKDALQVVFVFTLISVSLNSISYIAPHPPPPYDPYGGYPVPQVAMTTPPPMQASSRYAPVQKDAYNENFGKILFIYFMSFLFILQNTKDNPPCNTLFIGNLGENVNEEEVRDLFSMYES
ncbi:hypothetical protein BHE74_00018672 [Ensete ventricosum]|nr:hypothetical protein BHE74_00018672 [Ensete ventricosum]